MAKTHYETLGVPSGATSEQIRSAYRKLALQHHPDRSATEASKSIFLEATAAYEILSDPEKRRHYNLMVSMQSDRQRKQKESSAPAGKSQTAKPPPKQATIATDLTKLSLMFSRGLLADAERLANEILARDSRQAIPYAVLGDVARGRGDVEAALKHYRFAVQMDPQNPTYLRRVSELQDRLRWQRPAQAQQNAQQVSTSTTARPKPKQKRSQYNESYLLMGTAMVLCSAIYLVLVQREPPVAPDISLISTWTLGLCVMLFLSGVIVGSTLCLGGYLDRFYLAASSTHGRTAPAVALGTVAIVQFWGAAILYIVVQIALRSGHYSMTRLLVGIGSATILLGMACAVGGQIDAFQVWLWGGNLTYIGAMCGWLVADSLRPN